MERWYFLYSCDLPYGSVVATVFPAGESIVTVNVNLGSRQEIGEYRDTVPSEQVEALRTAIQNSGYIELPEPAPALPGTPFVFMAEGTEGSPPGTRRAFALSDLPPSLHPVMQAMAAIIESVRGRAHRVVSGEAAFSQREVRVGEDLIIDISLRNSGAVPVEFANPAGAATQDEVGLLLRVARDVPEEQLTDDDMAAVEFARDSVRVAARPGSEFERAGGTILLGPGEVLLLRATKPMLLPAGRFRAALTFSNQSSRIDAQHAAHGTLTMDLGTVTIQ